MQYNHGRKAAKSGVGAAGGRSFESSHSDQQNAECSLEHPAFFFCCSGGKSENGSFTIESEIQAMLNGAEILKLAREAEKRGADGIFVDCFDDLPAFCGQGTFYSES